MKKLVLAVLGLSATIGCVNERVYVDPDQGLDFGDSYEGNVDIRNAVVRGDIGPIREFDGNAMANGYEDDSFGTTNVTLTTQNDRGTGLVMIYLEQSIRQLPAGRTILTGSNENMSGNYVQLCSDSNDGSIHFDGIAEEVVIDIVDRGGTRDVNIDATIVEGFEGANYDNPTETVVTSSFSIQR